MKARTWNINGWATNREVARAAIKQWKLEGLPRLRLFACNRCGARGRSSHGTTYNQYGSGICPLCEQCWSVLTLGERMPFYRALWLVWDSEARYGRYAKKTDDPDRVTWPQIEDAVWAEAQ